MYMIYLDLFSDKGDSTPSEALCYQALCRIRAILDEDSLSDGECFERIEAIVMALENIGMDGGSRHDFG